MAWYIISFISVFSISINDLLIPINIFDINKCLFPLHRTKRCCFKIKLKFMHAHAGETIPNSLISCIIIWFTRHVCVCVCVIFYYPVRKKRFTFIIAFSEFTKGKERKCLKWNIEKTKALIKSESNADVSHMNWKEKKRWKTVTEDGWIGISITFQRWSHRERDFFQVYLRKKSRKLGTTTQRYIDQL